MYWTLVKVLISVTVVVAVSEVSSRFSRFGALLLALPLVSILAFFVTWIEDRDLAVVSRLARETLVLVPLGLPFFVPLAFAERWGLGFWPAIVLGIVLASTGTGLWLWLGPRLG